MYLILEKNGRTEMMLLQGGQNCQRVVGYIFQNIVENTNHASFRGQMMIIIEKTVMNQHLEILSTKTGNSAMMETM